MSVTVIAFFNNKGGVGKTTLVYHLAWMFQDLGKRVVATDLDPQANLTAAFLDENRLQDLWPPSGHPNSMFGAVQPLIDGSGDFRQPWLEKVSDRLGLLVGDLGLSNFEDQLSEVWPKCLDQDQRVRPLRITSSFWRIMQAAASQHRADLILMDLGPNLGAINRAALIAADFVVIPLSPDLFSLQGLRNLGPKLRTWRRDWQQRRSGPDPGFALPPGSVEPIGYLVQQHSIRLDRPVRAYEKWILQIPGVYREMVLNQTDGGTPVAAKDPNCLAMLKHYRSLIPISQENHKPMFHLRPADGAMGSHFQAAQQARTDFEELATTIASKCAIPLNGAPAQTDRFQPQPPAPSAPDRP
ncbi:MAG: ParA family protein [Terriglobales bacterium]